MQDHMQATKEITLEQNDIITKRNKHKKATQYIVWVHHVSGPSASLLRQATPLHPVSQPLLIT